MMSLSPGSLSRKRVYRLSSLMLGAVLTLGLAAGCTVPEEDASSPAENSVAEQSTSPERVPETVNDRVLATVAQELGVPEAELSLLRVNQEVWPDGCLGLGQDEACTLARVPGWQLEVVHGETSYFYRTDSTGEQIRRSTLAHNLPPAIAEKVLALAAAASGLSLAQLEIAEADPRVWDGCLGIAEPGQACPQIAIFGWRAVVAGNGDMWVYHTDMTGDDIRLNDL